jgi:hypothetical protein
VGDRTDTLIAATSANADTLGENEVSVLVNVTPGGTGAGGPRGHDVGCPSIQGGCRGASD